MRFTLYFRKDKKMGNNKSAYSVPSKKGKNNEQLYDVYRWESNGFVKWIGDVSLSEAKKAVKVLNQ